MPNKPTTPTTSAQRKKLFAAINRLLKEHNFANHKIVEIKVQPKSVSSLSGDCDGLPCESWQKPTQVITNGHAECICFPLKKPSN